MTFIENVKTTLDIITSIATLLGLVFSGYLLYKILLISSKPTIRMDHFTFWPMDYIKSFPGNYVITTQISFLNPAMGSKVVTEFEIDKIILKQNGKEVEYDSYAIMKNTLDSEGKIKPEIEEIIHPFIMMGSGELTKNIAFTNNNIKEFSFYKGDTIEIKLKVRHKAYNPLLRIPLIKSIANEEWVDETLTQTEEIAKDEKLEKPKGFIYSED